MNPVVPTTGTPKLLGRAGQILSAFFGPPGTGKTTTAIEKVRQELAAGVAPDDIAFTSFTNAACDAAIHQATRAFKFSPKDFPHFRTLHSMCRRLLRLNYGVMDERAMRAFGKQHGYQLSGTTPGANHDIMEMLGTASCEDDPLLAVYEWSRSRRLSLEEGQRICPIRVPMGRLRRFVDQLSEYKEEWELYDFTDMLELVVLTERNLDVSVAIIDESQDLSPLQLTVAEILFQNCKRVYLAGDDDQCLYDFAGADPTGLLSLRERCTSIEVLPQSFRVPVAIHDVAQRIIRMNKNRLEKEYRPRDGDEGRIFRKTMHQALDHIVSYDGTSFVLARNAVFLRPWMKELMERGVPFLVEGPAGAAVRDSFEAVQTAYDLAANKDVALASVVKMLDLVPSRGSELLPHGVKAAIEKLEDGGKATISRAALSSKGLAAFLGHLDEVGPVDALSKLPGTHRLQLKSLMRRHEGRIPQPRITLSTIHRAKGQERECVVIVPDMTRASYDEYLDGGQAGREAEHRAAYVAVTRAHEELVLVEPQGRRYFPYGDFLRGRSSADTSGSSQEQEPQRVALPQP
ncbi:MAG: UvrD-helicase domain-containing protein [Deltaproteobacteria bacterium]|nr:UvrD-helicase domain-containing protein [Deltaproteobacteria bacterium]